MADPTPPTDPRPPTHAVLRFAAGLSIVWLAVAAADGTLFALHARQSVTGSPGARFAAFELAASAAWAVALGAAVGVVQWGLARLTVRHRAINRSVATVVTGIAVLLLGLSWGATWAAGSFLDRDAIFFWLQLVHPFRSLDTVSPWLVYGVPVLAVAVTAVGSKALSAGVRRLPARWLIAIGTVAVLCVGTSAVVGLWPVPLPAPGVGGELLSTSAASPERVWEVRRYGSGPCAAALLDVTGLGAPAGAVPVAAPDVAVSYAPRLDMADYVRRVDPAARRPWNVVVVVVESLRADVLRALGGHRDVMPNVDRLAAGSVLFSDAAAQATHSNYAVACPLSGQYPLRSARQYAFDPAHPFPHTMVYDVLKGAGGYRVGLFSGGNEHWFGSNTFLDTPSVDRYQDAETFAGPTRIPDGDTAFADWARRTRSAGVVDDRHTVQSAIDWIATGPTDRPFFAYLNLQSSHFPYWVPPDVKRQFSPADAGFGMTFNAYPPERAGDVRDRYDDSLHYADAQLGRLFDHLRATGQWDRTVVVLTGDHGQAFYEHGFPTHANMVYQELVRVPLLFRAPGLPPAVDPYPAQHVDVPPSVLHLVGLPPHPAFQGLDLFDAAARPPAERRSVYTMVQTPLSEEYAVIRGGMKFVYDKRFDAYALYDLSADPGERHDLLNQRRPLAASLLDRLDTWRAVQLDYYHNAVHQAETYPPVVSDR